MNKKSNIFFVSIFNLQDVIYILFYLVHSVQIKLHLSSFINKDIGGFSSRIKSISVRIKCNRLSQINSFLGFIQKDSFDLSFGKEIAYYDLITGIRREVNWQIEVPWSNQFYLSNIEKNDGVVAFIIPFFINVNFSLVFHKFKMIIFIASTQQFLRIIETLFLTPLIAKITDLLTAGYKVAFFLILSATRHELMTWTVIFRKVLFLCNFNSKLSWSTWIFCAIKSFPNQFGWAMSCCLRFECQIIYWK